MSGENKVTGENKLNEKSKTMRKELSSHISPLARQYILKSKENSKDALRQLKQLKFMQKFL